MSVVYEFSGAFDLGDPAAEALERVAWVMGADVQDSGDGVRSVSGRGLATHVDVPQPEELDWMASILGFAPNLSLVFESVGGVAGLGDPERLMIEVITSFQDAPVRGLLFVDDGADGSLVLSLDHGRVVANERWEGWQSGAGLLEALPGSYELRELHLLEPDPSM